MEVQDMPSLKLRLLKSATQQAMPKEQKPATQKISYTTAVILISTFTALGRPFTAMVSLAG